jgi:hypothetical protein
MTETESTRFSTRRVRSCNGGSVSSTGLFGRQGFSLAKVGDRGSAARTEGLPIIEDGLDLREARDGAHAVSRQVNDRTRLAQFLVGRGNGSSKKLRQNGSISETEAITIASSMLQERAIT